MNRKHIAGLLVLVLLMSMVPAYAANVTIAAESITVPVSESEVTLPITLMGSSDILGILLEIQYDSGLTLVKAERGSALAELEFTPSGDLSQNPVKLLWDGLEAVRDNGEIAFLTFRLPEKPQGRYEVTVVCKDLYDNDFNDIIPTVVSGGILVEESGLPTAPPAEEPTEMPIVTPTAVPTVTPSEAPTAAPVSFSDLQGFDWAKDAILALADAHIISGTAPGIYEPSKGLTRAELLQLLVRYFDLPTDDEKTISFTDVSQNDWYYQAVEIGVKSGIVNGYEDGSFAPNRTISRQELATLIGRTLEAENITLTANGNSVTFSDQAKIQAYARPYVTALTEAGIISGMEDGTFCPQDTANRAQAAVLMYRLIQIIH